MFIENNNKNTITWQIDIPKKLFTEINENLDEILKMILDIYNIYIRY